jgi:hypothetical protein
LSGRLAPAIVCAKAFKGLATLPVNYRIVNRVNLVIVTYDGEINMAETLALHSRYQADPDFRVGHRHIVDLSRATSVDTDYMNLLRLQAAMIETVVVPKMETIGVYIAPTEETQRFADLSARGWRQTRGVVLRTVTSEAEACAILGLRQTRLRDLLVAEP